MFDHVVTLHANSYTPVDETTIPTGKTLANDIILRLVYASTSNKISLGMPIHRIIYNLLYINIFRIIPSTFAYYFKPRMC